MGRLRATKILNAFSLNANGETKTQDLPSDYTTTALGVTMTGANVTDEATLAELLAGLGEIRVITKNTMVQKWDADDLFYFNEHWFRHHPYFSKSVGAGADNDIRAISLYVPLNPRQPQHGEFDPVYGVTPNQNAKFEIVTGTDTAAGSDARKLTVTAYGQEGIAPVSYMGAYQNSYTAIVGDNFIDVQTAGVNGMFGAFAFGTTGREDLTSTDATGIQEIGWAVSRGIKESLPSDILQALRAHDYVLVGDTAGTTAPQSDYTMMDLGMADGFTIPMDPKLQVYVKSGVAEADRVYPLLEYLNL